MPTSCPSSRFPTLLFRCLTVLLLLSTPALADDKAATPTPTGRIYGSTTTILLPAQILDPGDPTSRLFEMPVYEYVTLGSDDVGARGFSVHLRGFGMVHVQDPAEGSRFSGDVLVGTLSYEGLKGRIFGRLGRQIIYDGAGNNVFLDGGYLRARPVADLDVSAWGGIVPYRRFDLSADRPAFGGRAAYNPWDWGRIGVSYAGERDGSEFARSALGLDYALRRFRWLDLSGHLSFDLLLGNVSETQNTVSVIMDRWWRFSIDHSFYIPSARIPRTSIFSVFTDRQFHAVGGEVAFRSDGWLSGRASGRFFSYGGGETGYQAGLKSVLAFRKGFGDLVGLEFSRLEGPGNAYYQVRAFGVYQPIRHMELTADVDNYFYDSAINGYKRSHVLGLDAGYEVFRHAHLQGGLVLTVNPRFEQQLAGLVKFNYDFSVLAR